MCRLFKFCFVLFALHFMRINAFSQCANAPSWVPALPPVGQLTATGVVLGIDTVSVRTGGGGLDAGRPGYSIGAPNTWRGIVWRSLYVYRGAGPFNPGSTFTSFKLKYAQDSNNIHLRVWDIRGDGFNTEHQRVQGYLAGVPVAATFKDFQNGAFITGGNVINGAATTTALVQSSARAFFNGPVDSIVVSRTALSDFIVMDLFARCDIVLPFKLSSFTGKQTEKGVLLEWVAEQQSGFEQYEIERSPDGTNWQKIGVKEMNAGQSKSYQFTDNNPLEGKNYYRLKAKDRDGSVTYSKAITINSRKNEYWSSPIVFPNPFDREIGIRQELGADPISFIRIYNYNSQLVKEIQKPSRNTKIPTQNWLPGTYLVHILTTTGREYSYKLLKQ